MLSVQQIKFEILAYIKEFDPIFSHWTVGASSNPKADLEIIHHVNLDDDFWIYKRALSEVAAQNICNYFHGILCCKMPVLSADTRAGKQTMVYAYHKTT